MNVRQAVPEPDPPANATQLSSGRLVVYCLILAACLACFLICCGACLASGPDAPPRDDTSSGAAQEGALVSRYPDPPR